MSEARWYVAHTYSGYEQKVMTDIQKTIENRGLQDQIFKVCVPMESVKEMKKKGKDTVLMESKRKLFPGYVLVNMIMNDETWYIVRNTRGVTGFVGPGSKPVALTPEEIRSLGFAFDEDGIIDDVQEAKFVHDFKVGDEVIVIHGAWMDTKANIITINEHKKTVVINVEMFGRETKVEIDFADVKKAE